MYTCLFSCRKPSGDYQHVDLKLDNMIQQLVDSGVACQVSAEVNLISSASLGWSVTSSRKTMATLVSCEGVEECIMNMKWKGHINVMTK